MPEMRKPVVRLRKDSHVFIDESLEWYQSTIRIVLAVSGIIADLQSADGLSMSIQ